jgi:hypothetical protein
MPGKILYKNIRTQKRLLDAEDYLPILNHILKLTISGLGEVQGAIKGCRLSVSATVSLFGKWD